MQYACKNYSINELKLIAQFKKKKKKSWIGTGI